MKLGWVNLDGQRVPAAAFNGTAVSLRDVAFPGGWIAAIREWEQYAPLLKKAIAVGQPIASPQWLCPLPDPPKFLLLAGNFRAHFVEAGYAPLPEGAQTPQFFIKPRTTLTGPTDTIPLVRANVALDYEAELGVIIGKSLPRNATREQALDSVWGYTVVNDVSERKLNANLAGRHMRERDDFFDWLVGKWFDASTPIGPCLVSKDEIADVGKLEIIARLNGKVVQQAPCSDMVHDIGQALVFISQIVTLEPGDVISMGTPAGVGMGCGRFLGAGDVIECEIPGIGMLANRVVE